MNLLAVLFAEKRRRMGHGGNGGSHFRATIRHINSAGPVVKIEAVTEWDGPVYVEMSQDKYKDLRVKKTSLCSLRQKTQR